MFVRRIGEMCGSGAGQRSLAMPRTGEGSRIFGIRRSRVLSSGRKLKDAGDDHNNSLPFTVTGCRGILARSKPAMSSSGRIGSFLSMSPLT